MHQVNLKGAIHFVGAAALLLVLTASTALGTDPTSFFIPVTDDGVDTLFRPHYVFDNTRNRLVIALPHGGVQRFDMNTRSFLTPWSVGTEVYGVDITPDGSRVLVPEAATTPGPNGSYIGRVHSIDANTGVSTDITWSTTYNNGNGVGAYDVAVANNGKALVTPYWNDVSGAERLREIDLATGTVTVRSDIQPNGGTIESTSRISRGQDRSRLMVFEGSTSEPISFMYNAATDSFGPNQSHYIYGGLSPDGSRVAAEYYAGTTGPSRVVDPAFNTIFTLPSVPPIGPLSWTYDPIRPIIYYTDNSDSTFRAISATDGSLLWSFHPGYDFSHTQSMAASADGQWIFAQVPHGILAIQVPCPGPLFAMTMCGALSGAYHRRRCP